MASMGEGILPDGASITRPPGFNGEHFSFWKAKFRVFVMATEYGLWDVFETGNYVPMKTEESRRVPKLPTDYDENDRRLVTLNSKAILMIQSALSQKEYFRICTLKTAKEMWEALEVAHEGTSGIKENRINTLITEFDLLRMKEGESIADFELRYTHLINQLAALGKSYEQKTQVRKILNILSKEWEAKVTAIEEAKGESMQSVASLFGSLSEYESKLKFKRELEEVGEKKKKSLALTTTKVERQEEDDDEFDDEEMGLIIRRFKKFYKGQGFRNSQRGGRKETKEIICYECGKPGHIKSECPETLQKNKEKRKSKSFNRKKAFVSAIWGDSSSDEESDDEEVANICLVAQEEIEEEEVSDSEPTYDELQSEYNALHSEFIKIVKELVAFKKKNKVLEGKLKDYADCEYCSTLDKKNIDLTKALEKFTKGSEMLNVILKAQRFVNDKSGIGYDPKLDNEKGKKKAGGKTYLNYFRHSVHTSNPFAHCSYCNRKGHSTSSCVHKRKGVIGTYKWVPKGSYVQKFMCTNPKGPKKIWVPKT